MALIALLIMLLNWAVAVLLLTPELLHVDTSSLISVKPIAYILSRPLDIIAIVLAFALKGRARLEVILASVLMLACWPGGYT